MIVGAILVASSLPKLKEPFEFLSAVYGYELSEAKSGMLVAMVIPYIELTVGLALLGGVFVGGAFLAAIGLFLLFSLVQSSAIARGMPISCGCFTSVGMETVGIGTLLRTVGFLVIALLGLAMLLAISPSRRVDEAL